ncbi:MAG: glycogen debranching N-terminal domain-containing protein [Bacteriovoracia bacterium]
MSQEQKNPDQYYVSASATLAETETRILKQGETFGIFDRHGDLYPISNDELGIYHRGTRYLSEFEFTIGNSARPLLLNSTLRNDNGLMKVEMTNPDMHTKAQRKIDKGSLYIQRDKFILGACSYEQFTISNYCAEAIELEACVRFNSDYRDIFEIRGMKRPRRGEKLETIVTGNQILLSYRGLDGVVRSTRVELSFTPGQITSDRVHFTLRVPAQGVHSFEISCHFFSAGKPGKVMPCSEGQGAVRDTHAVGKAQYCQILTQNEPFNLWLERSRDDLVMMTTDTDFGAPYPYAGIPWYCCPFGRDGIITALQCLWANPEMSRGVLEFLARTQATENIPEADANPGKIVHEVREGEMAALKEIPFGRYYGSVDATPLFLVLAGEYYERTGDFELIRRLWPSLERALHWIETYGDLDGDGFVEYSSSAECGLKHQGWKDSQDCVFHADGTDAEGPIALSEVQGYVYSAKLHMAKLARKMNMVELGDRLEKESLRLREKFDAVFWLPELGTYALALDGAKKPCRVVSSNPGHGLFSGIVKPERMRPLVETLMSEKMYSGWGIRTLATDASRYNPMSYHNGTVWPHDTALITLGLARAGFKAEVEKIFNGLFRASTYMELARLPEVYCGFPARDGDPPTLYPVACSPQAWASAGIYALVQSLLGIRINAQENKITFFKPRLPAELRELRLVGLQLGDTCVDVIVKHYEEDVGVRIERRSGNAVVTIEK